MIHDFLYWIGWYTVNMNATGSPSFWTYPLGLACSFVIMVYSSFRVLHPHYKADHLDTLFNATFAILFLIAFIAGIYGTAPHYLLKTWLMLAALRCLLRGLVDWCTGNKKAR